MTATLSIENVPDEIVLRLADRARRNGRTLQNELLVIVRDALGDTLTIEEAAAEIRRLNLRHPDESTALIRQDRDRDLRR